MGWLIKRPDPQMGNYAAGRDFDIVARGRPQGVDIVDQGQLEGERTVFGVRWQYRPDFGFPPDGFSVTREHDDGSPSVQLADRIKLPGYGPIVDRNRLLLDAIERAPARYPDAGPYFTIPAGDPDQEPFNELADLIPAIVLAGPYFDRSLKLDSLPGFLQLVGDTYGADLELAVKHWPDGAVPDIQTIISEGSWGGAEANRLDDTVRFCEAEATRLLIALSVRFEFAKFLGLGAEDVLEEGLLEKTKIRYVLNVKEPSFQEAFVAATDWLDASAIERPSRPVVHKTSKQVLPVLLHPHLKQFHPVHGDPALAWPSAPVSEPWSPGDRYPRVPSDVVSLRWSPPADQFNSGNDDGQRDRLLTLNPVLYQVSRSGSDEAGRHVLKGAERISLQKTDKIDAPDDTIPGWVDAGDLVDPLPRSLTYYVEGIDLLGILSLPSPSELVSLGETPPPAPPSIKIRQVGSLDIQKGATATAIDLELVWNANHDFRGPDGEGLFIKPTWSPRGTKSVAVTSSYSARGATGGPDAPISAVHSDCTLADIDSGATLTLEQGKAFAGGKLLTAQGEYVVLGDSPGTGATIRVRKNLNGSPPVGDAAIVSTETDIPGKVLDFVPRPGEGEQNPLRIVCVVQLDDIIYSSVQLAALSGTLDDDRYYIYLHAVGRNGIAARNDRGGWSISDDADGQTDPLSDLRSLGSDAGAFLSGSPALLYPIHRQVTSIASPSGFWAGQLKLEAAAYEIAPAAKGGFGAIEREVARLDDLKPPRMKGIGTLWARPAAPHQPEASYGLRWQAVDSAVRYEVDRMLTVSLGEEGKLMSDRDFLDAASDPQNARRFERRTNFAFANRFNDALPGASPLRAAYRIRAVSQANIPGDWSEPIGPVRTPDIRRPAPPVLLTALPIPGPDSRGRTVRLEWTQSGLGKQVENADKSADSQPNDVKFVVQTLDPEHRPPEWSTYSDNVAVSPVFENRFVLDVAQLPPGKELSFRVLAVKYVYDTISPYLDKFNPIASEPSRVLSAKATGDIAPPRNVRLAQSDGAVTLAWANLEQYQSLTLRIKTSQSVKTVELKVDQQRYSQDVSELEDGLTIGFELIATAYGRSARSGIHEIAVLREEQRPRASG
jgi:hypothetical protein